MKVVIDTNVVVSAAWRDRDPETVILWIAAEPGWQWIVSEEILTEYIEVLSRPKFNLTEAQRQRWRDLITVVTTIVEVKLPLDFPRDPADAKFLACAMPPKPTTSSLATAISSRPRNRPRPQSYPLACSRS